MTTRLSPHRAANDLTRLLNAAFGTGPDRFPVDVATVAKDYSNQFFPEDPITLVKGEALPDFDGGLYKAPPGKKGWGILYNDTITSPGRINFTLGHELGHYLLHRLLFPDGLECRSQDMVRWDSEYAEIEHEANVFAAGLLMPLDDFRRQIEGRNKPSLDDLGACADRYRVSLIAAALRWLEYTERRAVLVVSRDGYILWARSSTSALKTGAYFKTSGRPPIAVPSTSLAVRPDLLVKSKGIRPHGADVWLHDPCEEMALLSDQYDFTISLLHLDDASPRWEQEEEEEQDVFDKFAPQTGMRLFEQG
ncbi:MAG: ImmA/IrrE family metallo-endopeptidase [Sphingomonas sp.]|uniref:ImmA/IrrE family metallo-endopeptidase n=1 Tax=Sphingomonas sp. TaxID=28214 RepID=UPI0025DF1506|nr:ImmA/IrrE family metallo-endopeptidase [Sphingomonas sp.]MBQ1499610.1 ImmA/IrrE family metallo-endopeptidase [Sphingomonas sp.]MBQ8106030.1 ImmA/IrrE family metallo-endopeptidase [Afipia sp.]